MKDNKRVPTNTAQQAKDNPLVALLVGGPSGGIERQEAAGQREFVASEVLPTDMQNGAKEALERAGFRFLGLVQGDELFQRVEMAEGWKKRASNHSMWSEVIDPKGRKRGSIFYKAAFYDRKAHMRLDCRYTVSEDYDVADSHVHRIMDGEQVLHTMPSIPRDSQKPWESDERSYKAACDWLAENYPEHNDPLAYWDSEA